ncbi:MAG: choice-of-anchor B family protein [Bacteroidetes bacterium]|nr:choice-of-anchor B family protein [Bacteroidota bacterium]
MKFKYLFILGFIVSAFCLKAQVYSASNFTMISLISPETYTNSYNDKYSGCWGWYQASKNKEYAIAGSSSGTFWIDVTVPATPTVSAFRPGKINTTVWREIKTYQNYCYVVSDDGGPNSFQIFDMQYLPDSVHKVYDSQALFKRGHTLWVDGNKLYVAGVTYSNSSTSSMNVYSLATPSVPVLIRKLSQDAPFISYVHDMFVRNDTVYASCGNQGLYVFKLTAANTFTQLGSLTTYSSSGFNHSSCLTPNGQTLVFTDEVPAGLPFKTANVSNLSNIQVLATANQFSQGTPHNVFVVSNQYVFLSSYVDGTQLYDISNPSSPVLAGWFDTFPQGGGNNNNWTVDSYDGQWGMYPYFPSKNIFALDQYNGAFMLKSSLYMNPPSSPTVNFVGPANICAGTSATFTNNTIGATSYTWTFPGGSPATSTATNPTITYNLPGTFNIVLTAANGTVTSNGNGNITVIQVNGTTSFTNASCGACADGKAKVIPSGGSTPYTYTWVPLGGNAATAVNLPVGCYTVNMTDANGCTASKTVCVNFATGIQTSIFNNESLLVYPNPAQNQVTVELQGYTFNYVLYNALGSQLISAKNNDGKALIDLGKLSKGIYIIEIEVGKDKLRKKLIID